MSGLADLAESAAPTWHQQAACRPGQPDVDPNWFFPVGHYLRRREAISAARAVCWGRCPVRTQCEQDTTNLDVGVRGGYWLGDTPIRYRCGGKASQDLAEMNRRTDPRRKTA